MCRWLAYYGPDLIMREILVDMPHSLIDQSLKANLGSVTNADGFGLGWYGAAGAAVYRNTSPAWSDGNLREIAGSVASRLFLAHVRASTGTPVQQTNCHPFRHGDWLWMHNGQVAEFPLLKRDLLLAVDPALFPSILGSTDSELLFYLALTFGLDDDPPAAVARMVRFVADCGARHGVPAPLKATIAVSDGNAIWAFRYADRGRPPTLYRSADPRTLRALYPEGEAWNAVAAEASLVVSEPLDDLPGSWLEIPEQSYLCVRSGPDVVRPFGPAG